MKGSGIIFVLIYSFRIIFNMLPGVTIVLLNYYCDIFFCGLPGILPLLKLGWCICLL